MLTERTWTLAEAIAEREERLEELADQYAALDASTARAAAIKQTADRVERELIGLEWHRDEWGEEATMALGVLTAGERALMERSRPDEVTGTEATMWYLAAATVDAPWTDDADDIEATFHGLADVHPGVVEWAEVQVGDLSMRGSTGNRFRSYLAASESGESSTPTSGSTGSSSSVSHTD